MTRANPTLRIRRLHPDQDQDIPLPRFMTERAAGMDLCAAIETPLTLAPGAIALVPLGFAMALPDGYEAQIRPRSGLAIRHGVTVVNAPGTIDSDYRGEVQVGLINLGPADYTLHRGERIAQMVIQRVCTVDVAEVASLDDTPRGEGGFGSTGK
ncbi:dUTP diphosphatase [Desulfatitalea alkaliphila]|uniref:Deoxyuridine 5'-triphosphate nucleotidohydrolase n=1 Tax=Desulfatitalea alkaliphila TaxID=2929485 RepID=A0AA41R2V7_9BACT|nr:dUTP diphosphatase [Desulfatitalea alkaliphila]MCJ8501159.1 dUTP diphosphatase [Desulfatitalea alkaliphila]